MKRLTKVSTGLERLISEASKIAGNQRQMTMSFADSLVSIMDREKISR